jgi:hypothetical protein
MFKGFDEVRRLGLRGETEKEVRSAPPCSHGIAPGRLEPPCSHGIAPGRLDDISQNNKCQDHYLTLSQCLFQILFLTKFVKLMVRL